MLIEQDGPEWRERLPEIPVVPLSVQQHHRQKPDSIELAKARAARAAQEEGGSQGWTSHVMIIWMFNMFMFLWVTYIGFSVTMETWIDIILAIVF